MCGKQCGRKRSRESIKEILGHQGPGRRLCPLARPDIVMGLESQIEAWSAHGLLSRKIHLSQDELALGLNKQNGVKKEWNCTGSWPVPGQPFWFSTLGTRMSEPLDTEAGETVLLTSPFIEGSPQARESFNLDTLRRSRGILRLGRFRLHPPGFAATNRTLAQDEMHRWGSGFERP